MERTSEPYIRQIFVCTNLKEDNKPCCAGHKGEEIFRRLREIAKERALHPKIRVAQAKCLGQCATGTNVMIYPEEVWLKGVELDDVKAIAEEFIKE